MKIRPSRRELLSLLPVAALAQPPKPPPNIIFIMADDHAAHAISAYGSRINRTPQIDRLARDGVRLQNCFCTNSICTPSRAAILTGKYSHKNGVYTLADRFDGSQDHLAKRLQTAGYQTAIVGKWHLQSDPTGFDYWNILPGQGLYHDPVFLEMGSKRKHTGYCTDLITDFSLQWLQKRDVGKPFFLMCHHKAPHRPWQPAAKYAGVREDETIPEPDNLQDSLAGHARSVAAVKMKVGEDNTLTDLKMAKPAGLEAAALRKWAYQRYIKDYLRCVQSVDDNVGRLLDYLDANGLVENTMVVYTSDQGFFLGDHGLYDKRLMYEESIRMPLLMRYPRKIRGASVNSDLILNVDFAPALLDVAGVAAPPEMQGRSFRANLEGRTPRDWRKSIYYRYWMHNSSDHHVPAHYGVRTARHKLIYYYGRPLGMKGAQEPATTPEWELFDLQADPREMKNVYADPAYSKVVPELKAQLGRLQKDLEDKPEA